MSLENIVNPVKIKTVDEMYKTLVKKVSTLSCSPALPELLPATPG